MSLAETGTPDWPRALRLAAVAMALGWGGVGVGAAMVYFLFKAYQHGGL